MVTKSTVGRINWLLVVGYLTNKDRLCEPNEPRSYPVIEPAWSSYMKISFFKNKDGMAMQGCLVFLGLTKE